MIATTHRRGRVAQTPTDSGVAECRGRRTPRTWTARPGPNRSDVPCASSAVRSRAPHVSASSARATRPRRVVLGLFAIGSALATAGCGEAGSTGRWAGSIDTLENGVVLVSNPAEGVWTEETAWRLVEELRIGSVEGEGPAVFGQVNDIEVDAAGRIYVLDRQAQDVRVFDSDGSYVRTIGRPGEGPGEFRSAHGLEIGPNGDLWVVDSRLSRFSVFDTSGGFITSHARRLLSFGYWWDGGMLHSGTLYDYTGVGEIGNIRPGLTAFDPSGVVADTVEIPTYAAAFARFERPGGGGTVTAIPFKEQLHWTLDRRGYIWVGISNEYRLHQRSFGGDTLRTIVREAAAHRVSARERDSAMTRLREIARGAPVNVAIPETKPFYVNFTVDDDGYVWVRPTMDTGEPGVDFDVFDPDGRYLGALHADVQVRPWMPLWIRGGRLYAVHHDELDVPFVVVLRIEGR